MGKRSWKTSAFGALSIAMGVLSGITNPETLTNPETMSPIALGLGLLFARDGKVIETED